MSEQIKFYLDYIKENKKFIDGNAERLDIYEGNLLPYVLEVMKDTLSDNYFNQIKNRTVPINVLSRIIDKLSKVYINAPLRKDDNYQEFIDKISYDASVDLTMSQADEFSHLFKCYALEPFLDEGKACLRVIPADRFLVIGEDDKNPMKMTTFIKFVGTVGYGDESKKLFHAYTKDEFIPFTEDGNIYFPDLDGNDGVNVYGVIPFVYGNRSKTAIIPTLDSDIVQLTKMIPVMLSDMAGAIMFQCFTIIYGINVKSANLVMSPNAFWDIKSDQRSDDKPSIGTINPTADVEKVLSFIKQTFAFWLETKGVRIGSMNSIDAGNVSGIAKIIDEMDVYEIKKQQINYFKKEEKQLWDLMKVMNNYWIKANPNEYKGELIGDDFNPTIIFDEPRPEISREVEFRTIDAEYKGGYLDSISAISTLYPDLDSEEVEVRAKRLDALSVISSDKLESSDTKEDEVKEDVENKDESTQPEIQNNDEASMAENKNIQKTALNGAQVESLKEIAMSVANGELPKTVGEKIISLAFQISTEEASDILSGTVGFKPKVLNNDTSKNSN
jgi:hypothetical protein